MTYYYDYQGRRWGKSLATGTAYVYDGLNLMREIGTTTSDYLFGPGIDEPLAMNGGGQTSYYTADALGSVIGVTNAAGSFQGTYLYDAWGRTRTTTGSLTQPFVYTGREVGEASSLFYRARSLQPSSGRFLSEDPAVRLVVDSKYTYVYNDPAELSDPSGEVVSGNFKWGRKKPRVPTSSRDCKPAELRWCQIKCGALGFEFCKMGLKSVPRRVAVRDSVAYTKYVYIDTGDPNCPCNDPPGSCPSKLSCAVGVAIAICLALAEAAAAAAAAGAMAM